MVDYLNDQEKLKYSKILFNDIPQDPNSYIHLSDEDKKRVQPLLAQKIAYETIKPPVQPVSTQTSCLSKACFCFFPETYKQYFDLTSSIFIKRCLGTLMFWRNDFLTIGDNKFEMYGPMWIGITYACILSIAANLAGYFIQPGDNYNFNEGYILKAFGVVFLFVLLMPLIIGAIVKVMKGTMPFSASICIYGYSLLWFIVPTALCFIPSLYWQVGMLAVAAFFNTIFLVRNYYSYAGKDLNNSIYLLLVVIIIFEVGYFFIIKNGFFYGNTGYTLSQGTKNVNLHRHNLHRIA